LLPISVSADEPAWIFLIVMALALAMPLAAERLRVPGVIGLVVGGLVVGPHGAHLIDLEGTVAQLGAFGALYLMFLAGLELDMGALSAGRLRTVTFGLLTFLIPLLLGLAVAVWLGFHLVAALLIGSLWASHTLVTYPSVRRHGLVKDPAVVSTFGATIITDTLALLVLGIAVAADTAAGSLGLFGIRLVVGLLLLLTVAFVVVPRIAAWFFRGLGQDGVVRWLFAMVCLLGLAVLAQVAGTEPIVGAFLAGLALNRQVPESGVLMQRIEFIGSTFFIPLFLISVGMRIDLAVVAQVRTLALAAAFIGVVASSKYAAAWITGRVFDLGRARTSLMFGLSVAQAAATLAAAIVAFEVGLIDEVVVNATLMVMLVTVLLAAWVSERACARMDRPDRGHVAPLGQSVVVGTARPSSAAGLLEVAHTLARPDGGTVTPVLVVTEPGADDMREANVVRGQMDRLTAAAGGDRHAVLRLDLSVVRGLSHAALELDATCVVVGWTDTGSARRSFLGSRLDDLVARVPVPLVVANITERRPSSVLVADLSGSSGTDAAMAEELARRLARGLRGAPLSGRTDPGSGGIWLVGAPSGGQSLTAAMEALLHDAPDRSVILVRAAPSQPLGYRPSLDVTW
jgi:Kef-type K+ transport system membrane component KefB